MAVKQTEFLTFLNTSGMDFLFKDGNPVTMETNLLEQLDDAGMLDFLELILHIELKYFIELTDYDVEFNSMKSLTPTDLLSAINETLEKDHV